VLLMQPHSPQLQLQLVMPWPSAANAAAAMAGVLLRQPLQLLLEPVLVPVLVLGPSALWVPHLPARV
jgi:hypothetical protein